VIEAHPQALRVANKADLAEAWSETALSALAVSAELGTGLEALMHTISDRLVPDPPAIGIRFRSWLNTFRYWRTMFVQVAANCRAGYFGARVEFRVAGACGRSPEFWADTHGRSLGIE